MTKEIEQAKIIIANDAEVTDVFISYNNEDKKLALLKELADKLGYRVSKKPKKNP